MTFRFLSLIQHARVVALVAAWIVPLYSVAAFAPTTHIDMGGTIASDAPQPSAMQSALPSSDATAAAQQQSEETPSQEFSAAAAEAPAPASVTHDAPVNLLPSDTAFPPALFLAPAGVAAAASEVNDASVSDEAASFVPSENATSPNHNQLSEDTALGNRPQPQKALPRPLVSSLQQLLALENHVLMELQKHGIGKPVIAAVNRQPKSETIKQVARPPVAASITAPAQVATRDLVMSAAVSSAPVAVPNTAISHPSRSNTHMVAVGIALMGVLGLIGWHFRRRRAALIGSTAIRHDEEESGGTYRANTPAHAAAPSPKFSRTAVAALNELDMRLPPRVVSMRTSPKVSQPPSTRDAQKAAATRNDLSSASIGTTIEGGESEMTMTIVAENEIEAGGIQQERAGSNPIKLDFDLDLPSAGATSSSARRQLALAAEYIDMGDAVSARALLREIIENGDERLCSKARELLAKLDGLL